MKTLALFALASVATFAFAGCQPTPSAYYLSSITAGGGTGFSKDGRADNLNGQVGFQFSPNPYYGKPLPRPSGK